MSKKDFIALADVIRHHNKYASNPFDADQIMLLAHFCKQQNSAFNRDRWLSYIAGDQSVFPAPLAEYSQLHTTVADAVAYIKSIAGDVVVEVCE